MENKSELLDNSKILLEKTKELFPSETKDSLRPVYSLLHAASLLIKESGKNYHESVVQSLYILYHLEDCPGCVTHAEPENAIF